jgi:hypothetical protein
VKENKGKKDQGVSTMNTDRKGAKNANTNNVNGKYSKNQPSNVTASFQRDYPYAKNVTWSKYKGDWTASFGNGIYRSTAVYHANGQRKDTRTVIKRNDLPGDGGLWERIFKRNSVQENNIIRVEQPQNNTIIYRVLTTAGNALFFNHQGEPVKYNY